MRSAKVQNALLLLASLVFYGCCFLVCLAHVDNVYFSNDILYRYNQCNPCNTTSTTPFKIECDLIVANYLINAVYGMYEEIDDSLNFHVCDMFF